MMPLNARAKLVARPFLEINQLLIIIVTVTIEKIPVAKPRREPKRLNCQVFEARAIPAVPRTASKTAIVSNNLKLIFFSNEGTKRAVIAVTIEKIVIWKAKLPR